MALARPWLTDTACDRKSRRVIISNASKQAYDLLTCLRIASCLSDRVVCPDLVCGALATQVCIGLILELTGNSNVLKYRLASDSYYSPYACITVLYCLLLGLRRHGTCETVAYCYSS